MSFRTILGVLSAFALISSCTFPLSPRASAQVAFRMTIPAMPVSASSSASGSRLIVAETVQIRVTVTTEGAEDEVFNFIPAVETVSGVQTAQIEIAVIPGLHTFLIQTLDSNSLVLTAGEVTATLAEGPNQLSMTLTPPQTLALGDTPALAAGQVGYFTLPASLGVVVRVSGTDSTFWECTADGSFSGAGSSGSFDLDLTGASDKVLRVVQGTAGDFSVAQAQVALVDFSTAGGTFSADQSISLSVSTPGASIQYSINGGTAQTYATAIAVAGDGTSMAISATATAPGYLPATSVVETYIINYSQTSTVTFSPVGGTYTSDQSIVLTDATAGAVIEYSFDGTTYQPYNTPIPVAGDGTSMTIYARATAPGFSQSPVTSNAYTIAYSQAASVVFNLAGGTYTSDQSIVLTDATAGAVIQYSLNGGAYQTYTGAISVAGNGTVATIAARATAPGFAMSAVVSNTYTINYSQTSTVTFNPVGGTYASDQNVVLTDATSGAVIEYSFDGTTYQTYSTPIPVAGNGTSMTVYARATAPGFSQSPVTSNAYTIAYSPAASVVFNLAGGTYTSDQSIVLTDATPGAVIEYSLNGGAYQTYTGAISVAGNGTTATIAARATAAGFTMSAVTTNTYVIQYSGVTIDFTLPTEPVVLGANNLTLDATVPETLTVVLDSPAAFTTYTWYIDGTTGTYQMTAGWAFNGQAFTYDANSLVVQSQYMTTGLHEVLVIVQDGSGTYSAQFNVEVIR